MNITKHYFDDKDETTDGNFNHSLNNLRCDYTSFSTNDRILHKETLWNFRIKYGVEGKKFERVPIYENDKQNLEDTTNDSGFTYDGVSYRQYNSTEQRGEVIGYKKRIFEAENGLTIAQRMKGVVKIGNIRLEIPRVLFESLENFNNVLHITCNELSGFGNIHVPDNDDVSFIAQLIDTSKKYLIFTTFSEVNFITPINIKTLNFKISNPLVDLQLNDVADICRIQINNKGQLRIISDNIPLSFEIDQNVVLPDLTLAVNDDQVATHYCSVIDGYIKNADVIFRNIDGNKVSVTKSNDDGSCILKFKESGVLVATATDGVDTSYGEKNQVDLKNIFVPGMSEIYITPITTVITDYVIYKYKDDEELSPLIINETIYHFEQKLKVRDVNSDYILNANVRAGLISYQITTVIKMLYVFLTSATKKIINRSIISLKLSLLMYENFDFESADDIHKLFETVVAYYVLSLTDTQKNRLKRLSAIVSLNNTFKNELDFGTFADASKVVHSMMFMNINGNYTIEKIEELRLQYFNIRNGVIAQRNFVKIECDSDTLKDDVNTVTKILNDILVDFTEEAKDNVSLLNVVKYVPFETHFVLGRLTDVNTIEINSNFNTTSIFSLNQKSCSPQLIFILQCMLKIFCPEVDCVNLHCNDILQPRLCQSSYLTTTDLKLLENVGFIVDRNSSYVVNNDSIEEENTSSIEYLDDSITFAKQDAPLLLDEIKTNIPITDKNGYCSLSSVDVAIENTKLNGVLVFGKSVFGTAKIKPMFFVNDAIVKIHDMIIAKVGHKSKSVSFSFDVDENVLLRSDTIRLDFLFHFGSFKKSQVIASVTYAIDAHLDWVKLDTNMKINEPLHISVERNPVAYYKTVYPTPIENLQANRSAVSTPVSEFGTETLEYQNLGSSSVSSSEELTVLKYVKNVLFNFNTKRFKVLTVAGVATIQESTFEVVSNIEINNCVDFCYDFFKNYLFVVSSDQVHVLDDTQIISNYTNSNFASLKCIAGSSQIMNDFVVVVGDGEFHLVDTSDRSSLQKIGTLCSLGFVGSHRVCLNNTDSKAFVISRTENKLIQVDIRNRLLPVIDHELVYESMIEPRDLLFLHSKEHICVACYSSQKVLVFDVSDTSSPPILVRTVELLQNPCSISFDGAQNLYVVGKEVNNISTVELYDTNGNISDIELPYEYLFDDNDVDFIAVEEGIVTILCSDIMKMFQYNTNNFIEENRKLQDTSSLDLFLNADGYKIKHINRDVSGRHVLDLDTKFTVKNVNLSIEDIRKLTLINTDLQCNYTIEFTSKLSVE